MARIKLRLIDNPTGTIHGDLNIKLSQDIMQSIKKYTNLCEEFSIEPQLIVSGAISMYIGVLISLEKAFEIPPGVYEEYIAEMRKKRDDGSNIPPRGGQR